MQGHGALLQVLHGHTERMLNDVDCKDTIDVVAKAGDMPEPKTMLSVTIEANNVVSMATARELYEENMEEVVGGDM